MKERETKRETLSFAHVGKLIFFLLKIHESPMKHVKITITPLTIILFIVNSVHMRTYTTHIVYMA